ncbi:hypothetical protein PVK06_016545 [Gossypium arboreum]|uniref:Secreted protein n=1 Tax=Gossypium arboreum TaxID=29729 RepID=A0ABR0Q142_GOSAR|nr:hypothetical protein PVK06_016545 [Gossypium arboreum]
MLPSSTLYSFANLIFMNSSSTVASTVSCKLGNKNDFLVWILACLLRSFLGTPVAFINFHLFKAIVRCPSSSNCMPESFGSF